MGLEKEDYKEIVELALTEDLKPFGDLSSLLITNPNKEARAIILAKESGVLACSELIEAVYATYAARLNLASEAYKLKLFFKDGDQFKSGDILAEINAPAIVLLGMERTIMNFLQRLCGIATYTFKLTTLIKDYSCKILDTRKTMPGMRALEKAAFRCGGGTNHRFNLSDMVMLKENHLAVIGLDLITAITSMRAKLDAKAETKNTKIEVEINQDNLAKLEEILNLALPVDVVMLDNFSAAEIPNLVQKIRSANANIKIEISGGINENNLVDYAKTDPDYISTGSVFTKANNIDLSFLVE